MVFLLQQLTTADFGMASHSDWKPVFFKVGRWGRYVLSAAYNSLYGQALMAVLTNSRIPNTFISASAEKGNDGQISSSHITLAKRHTEGHGNVTFIYVTVSFKVIGNIRKIQYLAGTEAFIF